MGDDVKRDHDAKQTTQRNHLPGLIFHSFQNDLKVGYSLSYAVPLGLDESRIGVRSHGYKR